MIYLSLYLFKHEILMLIERKVMALFKITFKIFNLYNLKICPLYMLDYFMHINFPYNINFTLQS